MEANTNALYELVERQKERIVHLETKIREYERNEAKHALPPRVVDIQPEDDYQTIEQKKLLEQQVYRLLGAYVKGLRLEPNSVLFVNARRIDQLQLQASLEDLQDMGGPLHVIGVNGNPEYSLATRPMLQAALDILDGREPSE